MPTRVVLLPGALESEGERSFLESAHPAWTKLLQRGALSRIRSIPDGTPELEWIGVDPRRFPISEGVFIVAALGAEPPDRSVHFHMSLLSTDGECVREPGFMPTDEELRAIMSLAKRLETSRLKVVEGRGLDHALVWEDGSIELHCAATEDAVRGGLSSSLPEGDGEKLLHRFIDDSINLLSELELNRIRIEEGLPPYNLLWPWGPGFRPTLPNLTVERGASVRFEGPNARLAGLCRLVGYRHGDPWACGTGTNLRLDDIAKSLIRSPIGVAAIATVGQFRQEGKEEEAAWLSREITGRLIEPLVCESVEEPRRILIAATRKDGFGLALNYRSDGPIEGSSRPFSGEVAEDKGLGAMMLHEAISEVLTAR
jgi:hypothetical protein